MPDAEPPEREECWMPSGPEAAKWPNLKRRIAFNGHGTLAIAFKDDMAVSWLCDSERTE